MCVDVFVCESSHRKYWRMCGCLMGACRHDLALLASFVSSGKPERSPVMLSVHQCVCVRACVWVTQGQRHTIHICIQRVLVCVCILQKVVITVRNNSLLLSYVNTD